MKRLSKLVIKKYSQMPGEKKIRLGLSLSKMVRQIRKEGLLATGA
jgi:hypothetical protein